MPPTRFGNISTSSIQIGAAAQLSSNPTISNGIAALPWPRMSPCPIGSAPRMNRDWLLPPMASAVVPTQPSVRGCGG